MKMNTMILALLLGVAGCATGPGSSTEHASSEFRLGDTGGQVTMPSTAKDASVVYHLSPNALPLDNYIAGWDGAKWRVLSDTVHTAGADVDISFTMIPVADATIEQQILVIGVESFVPPTVNWQDVVISDVELF